MDARSQLLTLLGAGLRPAAVVVRPEDARLAQDLATLAGLQETLDTATRQGATAAMSRLAAQVAERRDQVVAFQLTRALETTESDALQQAMAFVDDLAARGRLPM